MVAPARFVLPAGVRIALPFLFLLAGACAGRSDVALDFAEASYLFPGAHVRSAIDEDHRFVRIKHPERSFELIYDSRIAGKTDVENWPQIFSLNDEGKPNVDRHAVGELKMVCRRAVHPRGGCGIEVRHRGTVWNAVFPRKDKMEAQTIKREALALLDSYAA
jgi:hypothetical protein